MWNKLQHLISYNTWITFKNNVFLMNYIEIKKKYQDILSSQKLLVFNVCTKHLLVC